MADKFKKYKYDDYPQRLAIYEDPRMELMGLRENSLGQEILAYLQSQNAVPEIKRGRYLGEGTAGKYTSFANSVPTNLIELIYNANPNTRQHEFAHAADQALDRQYSKHPASFGKVDNPTKFTDAYEKLVYNGSNHTDPSQRYKWQRESLANRLNPEWYESNRNYRASNKELAGWGAGTQVFRDDKGHKPAPLHLDPTMATELAILMELAMREKKK